MVDDSLSSAVDAVIELAPVKDEKEPQPDNPAQPQNPHAIFLKSGLLWDFAALQEIGRQTIARIKLKRKNNTSYQ